MLQFKNRSDAGRRLAAGLHAYAHRPEVVVLGIPRGGVPVAFEVAKILGLPLDIFIVRKLPAPGHEELMMGALASGGIRVLNDDVIEMLGIAPNVIEAVAREEGEELLRLERAYRGEFPGLEVRDKTVIVVDDGLGTGATMRAAIAAIREQGPMDIIVAVPAGTPEACEGLAEEADDTLCTITPERFYAVDAWYDEFPDVSDDEISEMLKSARV